MRRLRALGAARRGFSLVEILVAIIIMSIALVVLVSAFAGACKVQRKVRAHTIAQSAAQTKIDTLRNGGWALVSSSFGTTTVSVSGLENGSMVTTITQEQTQLAKIVVSITWGSSVTGENQYRKGHVRYTTYLAQPVP